MGMMSYIAHYKNKYPGGSVRASDHALDVYTASGEHAVALRKNGAGQWVDESAQYGCSDAHDLSPIPKDSRVHKIVGGKLGFDEHAEERKDKSKSFLCSKGEKVLSCSELSKQGFEFDEKQRLLKKPESKSE